MLVKETIHSKVSKEKEELLDEKRRENLKDIEEELLGKVLCYIGHFQAEKGVIEYGDAKALQSLLDTLGHQERINLILHSKGGDLDRAEKIISLIRDYCDKLVTIPLNAKSAATVICFGSNELIMGPGSELGPINPLVKWTDPRSGEEQWRAASSFVKGLEKIETNIREEGKPIELYIPLLRGVDYAFIERCRMLSRRSKKLARELLEKYLLSDLDKDDFENLFEKIDDEFLDVSSHNKVIDSQKIQEMGLPVRKLSPGSVLFKTILEYQNRALQMLVEYKQAKILETSQSKLVRAEKPEK